MSSEENIQNELINKFDFLKDKVRVQRARRIFAEVPQDRFEEVLGFAVNQQNFSFISTITGLDDTDKFSFIYHLSRQDGVMLNLKISVPKGKPVIKTITNIFPSADIFERELKDLLGVEVDGLPEGKRYPLPEDWPAGQYPLRKDWKCEVPAAEEQK